VSDGRALVRARDLARAGRLYPALILHGADEEARRDAPTLHGRTLLCERPPAERPCGVCAHCRRIDAARRDKPEDPPFHPDFVMIERDLKTATSAERTREALRAAHSSPFEARGQVFVVAEAHTLYADAGDALLKLLEEPGLGAPRHFLLLAPSRLDLPATLRSRSMALYLGPPGAPPEAKLAELAAGVAGAMARWRATGSGLHLLDAAGRLARAGDFEDPRDEAPWILAAAALRRAALDATVDRALRRPLLELAQDLLGEAPPLRLRGIPAARILEGLLSRRLAG
jgi:hypothetical protein